MENFEKLYHDEKIVRQNLEAKILQYSLRLKNHYKIQGLLTKDFDEFFSITTQRKGEVNESK